MKINLNEWKAAQRAEHSLEIETDGETFVIDPPQLWPDEAMELAKAGDSTAMCELVMGADTYARFKAAGGSSGVIGANLAEWTGLSMGGSSASS